MALTLQILGGVYSGHCPRGCDEGQVKEVVTVSGIMNEWYGPQKKRFDLLLIAVVTDAACNSAGGHDIPCASSIPVE
jgi:hypothetical protein